MKHLPFFAAIGAVFVGVLCILSPVPVHAFEVLVPEEDNTTGDIRISSDEVIQDDVFIVGNSVVIEGVVEGDVFVFAGRIEIPGTIQGDVFAGAGDVLVSGMVGEDLYVASGTVDVSGSVGDNAVIGSGQAFFRDTAMVGRDLVAGTGMLDHAGVIGRYLTLGTGSLALDGTVQGSVRGVSDATTVGSNAVVQNDVDLSGANEPVYAEGSVVRGESTFTQRVSGEKEGRTSTATVLAGLGQWLLRFLSLVLVGAVIVLLMPAGTRAVEHVVKTRLTASLGAGLVVMFLLPIVAFVLLFTLVGIKLSILLAIVYIALLLIAPTFVGLWIGRLLLSRMQGMQPHDLWVMTLGLFVVSVLTAIPFGVGFLFTLLVAFLGTGGFLLTIFGMRSTRRNTPSSSQVVSSKE